MEPIDRRAALLGLASSAAILAAPGARAQATDGPAYAVTYLDVGVDSTTASLSQMRDYQARSRGEDGNLEFCVLREIIRPNRFVVFEGWRDSAALSRHAQGAATADLNRALAPVRNSPPFEMQPYRIFEAVPFTALGADAIYAVEHLDFRKTFVQPAEQLVRSLTVASRAAKGALRFDAYLYGDHHYTLLSAWQNKADFDRWQPELYAERFREMSVSPIGRYNLYDPRLYTAI